MVKDVRNVWEADDPNDPNLKEMVEAIRQLLVIMKEDSIKVPGQDSSMKNAA